MAYSGSSIDIDSRLELFVDSYLIDRLHGAETVLQHPVPQEVSLLFDQPWEGNTPGHVSVFQDGDVYKMYYRGSNHIYGENDRNTHEGFTCYAESKDGINWTKPSLGIVEFEGSTDNNIILGNPPRNFSPFKDTNPDVESDAIYKAVALEKMWQGLFAYKSPDGIHWSLMTESTVITDGAFDSPNLVFWDGVNQEYREYHRDFREDGESWQGNHTGRDIKTSASKDLLNWSDPVWLKYSPGRVSELYTNGVQPYSRAPHIFLGFPTRYHDRGWTESTKELPHPEYRKIRATNSQREGTAITDGMFMSSRDGYTFDVWPESFIRPGLRTTGNWFYGDGYQNKGLIETESTIDGAGREISVYVTEATNLVDTTARLRRHTLRIDGFVSVNAKMSGGELLTKPIVFAGRGLYLNFSTGAAGSIGVEIQNEGGMPIDGFTLEDSHEIWGDALSREVKWKDSSDVSALSGQPIRIRFLLKDADLYSMKFH